MPFVAFLNGCRVETWRLSPDEWVDLKRSYKTSTLQMLCGNDAVPKNSPLGLQYFAHKPNTECTLHEKSDESPEHLRAKTLVAEAAESAGWKATIEYPAPDRSWIADVLLEKGDRRLVVEVQLSPQSIQGFEYRQGRYLADGLECVWLVGPRIGHLPNSVPYYRFTPDLDQQSIRLQASIAGGKTDLAVSEAIPLLIEGGIADEIEPFVTSIRVATRMSKCFQTKCDRWFTAWYVEAVDVNTRCGQSARFALSHYEPHLRERVESLVQNEVRNRISASDLAKPTRFESRRTAPVPDGYIGQICPHCGYIQGDFFLAETGFQYSYDITVNSRKFPLGIDVLQRTHRCDDSGRGRCVPSAPHPAGFPNRGGFSRVIVNPVPQEKRDLPERSARKYESSNRRSKRT